MKRSVVPVVVFVVLLATFWGFPVSGGNVQPEHPSDLSSDEANVNSFDSVWTKDQTETFVNAVVYPVLRDPGYYPGSDFKMGIFAILMGCIGGCAEWIAHVVEVDSITPDYMCKWLYKYAVSQDYGRHKSVKGKAVEVVSREEYLLYLESFLGTGAKPDCPQFLVAEPGQPESPVTGIGKVRDVMGFLRIGVLGDTKFPWEIDYYNNNDRYVCGSSYGMNDMYCTGGGCPSFACTKAGYIATRYGDGWTCCQVPGTNKYCQSSYVYQTTWGTCEYRSDGD